MNALICTTCDILQRAISTEWVRIGCLPVATVLLNAIDLLQVFSQFLLVLQFISLLTSCEGQYFKLMK